MSAPGRLTTGRLIGDRGSKSSHEKLEAEDGVLNAMLMNSLLAHPADVVGQLLLMGNGGKDGVDGVGGMSDKGGVGGMDGVSDKGGGSKGGMGGSKGGMGGMGGLAADSGPAACVAPSELQLLELVKIDFDLPPIA